MKEMFVYKMEAMTTEEMQRFLNREAEKGSSEYEALKALTRTNNVVDEAAIHAFIDTLHVNEEVKKELRAITPHNYTGF